LAACLHLCGISRERLAIALDSREEAMAILRHHTVTEAFGDDLARHIASTRLSAVKEHIEATSNQFAASTYRLSTNAVQGPHDIVGDPGINPQHWKTFGQACAKLSQLRSLETALQPWPGRARTIGQRGSYRNQLQEITIWSFLATGKRHGIGPHS
jgi:hypothetical protein